MNKVDFAYINGNIYTMDQSKPTAQAIGWSDGTIVAVGTDQEVLALAADDCQVRDLEGNYVFPGFIDAHRTLFLNVLEMMYFKIDSFWDLETTLEELSYYVDDEGREDPVFGYGFNPSVLTYYDTEEERARLLDDISDRAPIILLSRDGKTLWINTIGHRILDAYKEEEGLTEVPPFEAIEVLTDIDREEIASVFFDSWLALAESGFTTTVNMGSPECINRIVLESVYSDANITMLPMLNIADSFFVNTYMADDSLLEAYAQKADLNFGMERSVYANMLIFRISKEMEYYSPEELKAMVMKGAEVGANIHIEAMDLPSIDLATDVFSQVRGEGFTDNTLVIASDYLISNPALTENLSQWNILYTWNTWPSDSRIIEHSTTSEQAIRFLTTEAAKLIGMEDSLGSLTPGNLADMTIYETNPLLLSVREFASQLVLTTVSRGAVTYDANEEIMKMAFDMMEGQLI